MKKELCDTLPYGKLEIIVECGEDWKKQRMFNGVYLP